METYELKCDKCGKRIGHLTAAPIKVGRVLCAEHHDGVTGLIADFDMSNGGCIHPDD